MKKIFTSFLVFLFIIFTINNVSHAQEANTNKVSILDTFDPYYLELMENGILKQGIFIDEQEYIFYTNLKKEFNYVQNKLKIFENYTDNLNIIIKDHKDLSNGMLNDLKDVKTMINNSRENWWDQNKFFIGFGAGAIIATVIFISVK